MGACPKGGEAIGASASALILAGQKSTEGGGFSRREWFWRIVERIWQHWRFGYAGTDHRGSATCYERAIRTWCQHAVKGLEGG